MDQKVKNDSLKEEVKENEEVCECKSKKCKCKKKEKRGLRHHLYEMGFTNRLAVYLVLLLTAGLVMGFVLAKLSIASQYTGALMCFTVVFTPIGTACSIVLNSIVKKSQAENTWGSKGVKYAAAEAVGFHDTHEEEDDEEEIEVVEAVVPEVTIHEVTLPDGEVVDPNDPIFDPVVPAEPDVEKPTEPTEEPDNSEPESEENSMG